MRRHDPAQPRALTVLAALIALGLASSVTGGCGRKMSEADCRKVADHLGEVWSTEAKKDETDGPGKEKATDVIRQEGERLSRDWMEDCKKDLVGKNIEQKELDCLMSARSLSEIQGCADSQQ